MFDIDPLVLYYSSEENVVRSAPHIGDTALSQSVMVDPPVESRVAE